MKVVALGGCGAMGRAAVKALLKLDAAEEVVIADLDVVRATAFAESCGAGVSAHQVDIEDDASLARAFEGADLVMNTVGPFFRFGPRVLEACIEQGCHYADINDDPAPTLDMLALDERARAAGMTAVIGMGASPGLTNLLAVLAMAELDATDTIYTGWELDSARPESGKSAAMIHGTEQLTGTIRVWTGGAFAEQKARRRHTIDYPGLGKHPAWTIGHPETITLPRCYPNLRTSLNVVHSAGVNIAVLHAVAWLVDHGVLTVNRASALLGALEHLTPDAPDARKARFQRVMKGTLPPLFAVAIGTKAGEEASAATMMTTSPKGGLAPVTGIPLAVATALIATGRVRQPGVHPPEAVLDPSAFFETFGPFCSPPVHSTGEAVLTTRSWKPETLAHGLQSILG